MIDPSAAPNGISPQLDTDTTSDPSPSEQYVATKKSSDSQQTSLSSSSTPHHPSLPPLPTPQKATLSVPPDHSALQHDTESATVPNTDPLDANIKQPVSAPSLVHRRSIGRSQTHKRRPSITGNITASAATGAHYSKPIEMPPGIPVGGLRLDSSNITSNVTDLDRLQSHNPQEMSLKQSGSGDQRAPNRGGSGNALKKQITKFSKFAGGGHRIKVKDGEIVFKGHRNWEIVLSIQFGLKYTSELLEDANGTDPIPKDYEECFAFDFNPSDEQRATFEVSKFAKWVHPAPFVYKAIRKRFGVREKDFLDATCSESRVRELPTPGKSGALFYITDDERYFMKTISHIEDRVLVSMLPSYYTHVCSNPRTFLTQYMAHFSVQTRRDRHIRMVVMASIFNDQIFIDRKFDLKGSTYKRFASPEQLESANVTLKDQDFDNPLFFRPEVVEQIIEQLKKDSAFLESHHVMDYSLLLGLSDMQREEDRYFKDAFGELEERAPYYIGYQRGPKGEKLGVRVSMGIIDFLQRFRLRKKMEYGMRVLQSCSTASASVAPPHLYRERFMQFVSRRFLADPDLDMAQLKLR